MEPDDRTFILKWSRTWPDAPKDKGDFTGRHPDHPRMFARIYHSGRVEARKAEWFWTVSDRAQIASGYEENARAAARAAEAAWERWLAAR
jgi:hypothetical protein